MKALLGLLCISLGAFGQEWITQLQGPATTIHSIVIDHRGNIFVSGLSAGTNVLALGSTNLPSGSFFVKYNPNGNLLSASRTDQTRIAISVGNKILLIEGTNLFQVRSKDRLSRRAVLQCPDITVQDISPCDDHSFVIAGEFNQFLTIHKTTLISSVTNGRSFFAARLKTNGKVVWLTEVRTSFIHNVAGTREGGAYLLENFNVRALNKNGEQLWLNQIPGSYSGLAYGVAVDRNDRCFVCGGMQGEMQVGGESLHSQGGKTAFVYGFEKNGEPSFVWMLSYSPLDFSSAYQVAFDRANNWYVGMTYIPGTGAGYDGLVLQNGSRYGGINIPFGGTGTDTFNRMAISRDRLFISGRCDIRPGDSLASIGSGRVTNTAAFIANFKLR